MLAQDVIWTPESSTFLQKIEHSKRTDFKTIILKVVIVASKLEIQVLHEGNTWHSFYELHRKVCRIVLTFSVNIFYFG